MVGRGGVPMKKVRGIGLGLIILGALAVGGCSLFINRPPVAEFTIVYNPFPDEPLVVTLDASMSSDEDNDQIVDYMWTFPDEEVDFIYPLAYSSRTVHEPTIIIRFPVEGEYTVTLMVRDERGKSSEVPDINEVIVPNEEVEPTE